MKKLISLVLAMSIVMSVFMGLSFSVAAEDTLELHIETTPFPANATITYSSGTVANATVAAKEGNNKIAVVTGVKAGTTTIKVALADNAEDRRAALAELEPMQQKDFEDLYEIMDEGTEYEHTATSDWYRIDRATAKGVDSMGDEIDLTEVLE